MFNQKFEFEFKGDGMRKARIDKASGSTMATFFSEGNKKNLFYNFNTATHGGLKNIISEFFF
jgi:hypothetical protein